MSEQALTTAPASLVASGASAHRQPLCVTDMVRGKLSLRHTWVVYRYLLYWFRHPDPGSAFAKATRYLRWLPGPIIILLLVWQKYDGLVVVDEKGRVEGHVFSQRHRDGIHIFSVSVDQGCRKQGLGLAVVSSFLERIWRETPTRDVRISAGGHPAMRRIWEKLVSGQHSLPFRVLPGQKEWWVSLAD